VKTSAAGSERWDVVVVGAGMGGLTAATGLAAAGRRVLVVERRPHPGGTAYTYRRGDYRFPMGPLGFSSTGLVGAALEGLGAGPLETRRVHYRVRAAGVDVRISQPLVALCADLTRLFPGDAVGVRAFFDEAGRVAGELGAGRGAGRAATTPAGDVLRELVGDARLRNLLGSLGTRPPYSSMALIAAMWHLMTDEGIRHPRAGMAALCDRLVVALEAAGGEVRLRSDVAAIVVENGRVAGVELRDGTRIEAAAVVSNADFKRTFGELVDGAAVDARFARAVAAAPQTGSLVQVCLGIEAADADLSAFADASRIIYRRDDGVSGRAADARAEDAPGDRPAPFVDWSVPRVDPRALAGEELELALLSADDPTLAPPGGAVIVIRVHADHAHFSRLRPAAGRRTSDYAAYKRSLADALIEEAGRLVAGLRGAARVVDVATPLTFEELGGRSQGAVAGWSWSWSDAGEQEGVVRELVRTPVRGLYMAGYQALSTLFLGGVPTAVHSGARAADCVLRAAGPDRHVRLPGVAE
jgi:all-trans-retinol 13,14-reductase